MWTGDNCNESKRITFDDTLNNSNVKDFNPEDDSVASKLRDSSKNAADLLRYS
jgi:hypothetical protein